MKQYEQRNDINNKEKNLKSTFKIYFSKDQNKTKMLFHPNYYNTIEKSNQNNTKLPTYIYLPSEYIFQKESEIKTIKKNP